MKSKITTNFSFYYIKKNILVFKQYGGHCEFERGSDYDIMTLKILHHPRAVPLRPPRTNELVAMSYDSVLFFLLIAYNKSAQEPLICTILLVCW